MLKKLYSLSLVLVVLTTALWSGSLSSSAAGIKLVLIDIDGVLTDGKIIYSSGGDELKIFDMKDINAFATLKSNGYLLSVISQGPSVIMEQKAEALQLDDVLQNVTNKQTAINTLCTAHAIDSSAIAYIGVDTKDIAALQAVGLACCPHDAPSSVQSICGFVSTKNGGQGVVREVCDLLVNAKNSSTTP
ncbi:MAG: 3-deoxy-D-manno-octulosonate 8-phosphate phosphatase, YrbI family [Chlamydiia bacterium]|nr:3-deoxy-D-manno-octulosonate 8-phosphate phosphatase, YrbI family [Chlamydiia bacterium]